MTNIFHLYRFLSGEKVSSMRLMLYVLLGLALSKTWNLPLFIYDLLFVFGGVLFASLLNDYYDYKLQGEQNSIGKMISERKISEKRAICMIWLPCTLPVCLFYPMLKTGVSTMAIAMLTISFFLSFFYCSPPLRLKKRKFFGIVTPPIGIYLLFLQAVLLTEMPDTIQWIICAMVFIFSWYLDFIHLANDSICKNEIKKTSGYIAMKTAKVIAVFGILSSLAMLPVTFLGIAPLLLWTLRLQKIWQTKPEDLTIVRKNLFSRIYCIEEFAIYAVYLNSSHFLG